MRSSISKYTKFKMYLKVHLLIHFEKIISFKINLRNVLYSLLLFFFKNKIYSSLVKTHLLEGCTEMEGVPS